MPRIAYVWLDVGRALVVEADGTMFCIDRTKVRKAEDVHLGMLEQAYGGKPDERTEFGEHPYTELQAELIRSDQIADLSSYVLLCLDREFDDEVHGELVLEFDGLLVVAPPEVIEGVRRNFCRVPLSREADFSRIPREGPVAELMSAIKRHYGLC